MSSVPFFPTQIPNCTIWLDAADGTTINRSGNNVTSWTNKGTATLTAATPTGTITSGVRSFANSSSSNVIQFNGSSYLTMPNVVINQSPRCLFFIFSVTAYGDGYNSIMRSTAGTTSNQWGFTAWNRDTDTLNFFRADGTTGFGVAGQSPYSGTLPYDGTPFFIAYVNSPTFTYIGANGTSFTSINTFGSSTYSAFNTNSDTFNVGNVYANTVLIGEIIEYTGGLNLSDVNRVEGYLAWKWGRQTSLPVTHPYRNSPPTGRTLLTTTQLTLVNSFGSPGIILLPSSFTIPGNTIAFKDQNGAFSTNAMTLTTNNANQRIDGTYFSTINNTRFGWQSFIAGNNNNWYTVGGTLINTINTTTLNALFLSTPSISTANVLVSTMGFVDQTFRSTNTLAVQSSLLYYNFSGFSTILAGTRQSFGGLITRMGGVFNPRQITNLNFWLDAADPATQVITSGYVTQWLDKGPNAYTFSNAVLTGRTGPTRRVRLNGLNVLTFTSVSQTDANGQFLLNARAAINENLQTIFILNNPTTVNAGGTSTYWGNTSIIRLQPGGYIVFPYSNLGTPHGYINDQVGNPSGLAENSVANTYNLIVANIANGAQSVWRNGTQQNATTKAITSSLLTGTYIGCYAGNNEFYSGTIAEIIVYNAALTTIQRQQVEGYLSWKWGLVANLPSSHPFKNSPP